MKNPTKFNVTKSMYTLRRYFIMNVYFKYIFSTFIYLDLELEVLILHIFKGGTVNIWDEQKYI